MVSGNLSSSNFFCENHAPEEESSPSNHPKHKKMELDVTQVNKILLNRDTYVYQFACFLVCALSSK